jgi:hypothetical protein
MWAHSLYFLYLLLLSIPKILASSHPMALFIRHVGLILIFLEDPAGDSPCSRSRTARGLPVRATFTGNSVDALCRL